MFGEVQGLFGGRLAEASSRVFSTFEGEGFIFYFLRGFLINDFKLLEKNFFSTVEGDGFSF